MVYCKTCGALVLSDNSKCNWCNGDPNIKSNIQRRTAAQLFISMIVAVVAVVAFLGTTVAINTTVAARDISNDMTYEEVADLIVQSMYVTSDTDVFFDAIHPKQFETYVRAANMPEEMVKATFRNFLLENNKDVVSAEIEIVNADYDLTGTTLEEYTKNFNFFYGANIDAVKGVEILVTVTKENGEVITETVNMVLVHQNNRWYLDADEII